MTGEELTVADLGAIELRANAATVGAWVVCGREPPLFGTIGMPVVRMCRDEKVVVGNGHDWGCCAPALADAEFIAHAREDIPGLIAEVRRLKELVRLREEEIGTQREMTLPMLEHEACLAERERCARVVEGWKLLNPDAAKVLANRIRGVSE